MYKENSSSFPPIRKISQGQTDLLQLVRPSEPVLPDRILTALSDLIVTALSDQISISSTSFDEIESFSLNSYNQVLSANHFSYTSFNSFAKSTKYRQKKEKINNQLWSDLSIYLLVRFKIHPRTLGSRSRNTDCCAGLTSL